MRENPTHLGDGVYAHYNKVGDGGVTLMANSHITPTDTIHLEPQVHKKLQDWLHTMIWDKSKCQYCKVPVKNERGICPECLEAAYPSDDEED